MQIDFHHAVTYIVARLGGLDHTQASVVAHAAQYVDDAVSDGVIQFDDNQRYTRVTSAHKMLDPKNLELTDNRLVWVPFHFLPGNATPPVGVDSALSFEYRMMCKPDSAVARAMIASCLETKQHPFALHRLGVALHTYVDTWAHQQFLGIKSDLNVVKSLDVIDDAAYVGTPVYNDLTSGFSKVQSFVANHVAVGHGGALTSPDMPFLKWSFTRKNGEKVVRDNPQDFLLAARGAFNAVRRFVANDSSLADIDLPAWDVSIMDNLLRTTLFIEGELRHPVWLDAIMDGKFSFGGATVSYVAHGADSWKMKALGQDPLDPDEDGTTVYKYSNSFLTSDWKLFHDAVQYQRLYILHTLLPGFGLCAA